ncbi:hypothetical protein [Suttonella ornithocola]|uniref:Uncharacterized protein n=1 Tax=Suttonella ornithocola TaxID=279832 RepID=A0A380RAN9_9GAMM|nr:hypothetical protein [Suttonella ornithocola]SUQ09747.1 Uncharacterised protein [Suttonella ornithocola]
MRLNKLLLPVDAQQISKKHARYYYWRGGSKIILERLGIKENDDGSYTISAVSHDAQKEAVTDKGATRVQAPVITRHSKPQVYAPQLTLAR